MNRCIYTLIVFAFISCTYAGGKKESTLNTDTIMKTDTIDKNSLEYITSILPLYERIYDPVTGLEMYDEELMKDAEWNKVFKTADGWIIDIWTSDGIGGTYKETPPLPGFYEVNKIFYPDGKLKSVMKIYERSMRVGTGLFYDEAGNLTEEVNYDAFYKQAKIPFEEALEIFDKTGFIDLKTGKGRLEFTIRDGRVATSRPRVYFDYRIREGIPYWIAKDGFNGRVNAYEINALTGEVKKVTYNIPFEE